MDVVEGGDPISSGFHFGYFEEGAEYATNRKRGCRSWLLIATLDGAGLISSSNSVAAEVKVGAGDLALFLPNRPHYYQTSREAGHWNLAWTHFFAKPEWGPLLPGTPTSIFKLGEEGLELGRRIKDAAHSQFTSRELSLRYQSLLLESVLLKLAGASLDAQRLDPRVERVIALMKRDFGLRLGLTDWAAEIGLSVSRFSHLFREETGESPAAFAERIRIDQAQQLLLTTTWPLSAIAERCGFANEFHFSARFKALVGLSPSRFKSRERL